MKSIFQNATQTGLAVVLCIFLSLPGMAQRGGHSGGGSGGGHINSGGGGGGGSRGITLGGGGYRASSSFSNPGSNNVGIVRSNNNTGIRSNSVRPSAGIRAGAVAPRGYIRSVNANGTHVLATRGFVQGSYGHSYASGGVYARPYGWERHGGFFYSHGYYGSLYYPWLGLSFGYLPWGYYPFWWGGAYFYYSDGLFYQYNNEEYTVVEPPLGAEINKLPAKAQSIVIDGQQYFELNGVYYQPITKDDGTTVYQVAGKDGQLNTNAGAGVDAVVPKVGDIADALPADTRKVKLNGQILFVSDDGIYYEETTNPDGKKAYKIVAIESDAQ